MPKKQIKELADKDILYLGRLQHVFELLERLQPVGCQRDKAGNRRLFFDDYCKLILLYIWNPLIGSMSQLQQAVGLPRVAKALGVRRFSAGSFSESPRVFDPEQLKPIIQELAAQLVPHPQDPRLAQLKSGDLKHVLTLVDGTVLEGLSRLARSACIDTRQGTRYNTRRDGTPAHAWRLHTQF